MRSTRTLLGGGNFEYPHVAYIEEEKKVEYLKEKKKEPIPDDEIWYTTVNGEITVPQGLVYSTPLPEQIVSNTYKDGKGVMKFDRPVDLGGYGCHFQSNRNLLSVEIPNSVEDIGDMTFDSCGNLKYVTLPTSLKQIGDHSFYCCALESIEIPNSVERIDTDAFNSCPNLKDIIYKGTKEQWHAINHKMFWPYLYATIHCLDGDIDTQDLA